MSENSDPGRFAAYDPKSTQLGKSSSLETISSVVKTAAVIVAGIWAFYEWHDFRKESQDLQILQQKAQLSQSQYEVSRQDIITKQLELSNVGQLLQNEQAKFSVQQQNISKKQQELAVEMSRATLAHQAYQTQLAKFTANELLVKKLEVDTGIKIVRLSEYDSDGFALYKVWSNLYVKNTSKDQLTVCFNAIEIFIASQGRIIETLDNAANVTAPPNYTEFNQNEATSIWKNIFKLAHVYQSGEECSSYEDSLTRFGFNPVRGGGGTNVLQSNETIAHGPVFLVKARKTDWIGVSFVVGYGERYLTRSNWETVEPGIGEATIKRWSEGDHPKAS